jgi:hypothetical protein
MNTYKQGLIDELHVLLAKLQVMQADPNTPMLAMAQTARQVSHLCDRLDILEMQENYKGQGRAPEDRLL